MGNGIGYNLEPLESTYSDIKNERVSDKRKLPFACLYQHSDGSWRTLGSFSFKEGYILNPKPLRIPKTMEDISVAANIYETLKENNDRVFAAISKLEEGDVISIDYINFVSGKRATIGVYFDGEGFSLNNISLNGELRYTEGTGGNKAYVTYPSDLLEEILKLTL
ncbi:hypothetical protein J4459_00740 [Candidatus Woesearchaeota archaeon]|nr:hypothetical protein [Candidatus Woesearchaeota archaeon]